MSRKIKWILDKELADLIGMDIKTLKLYLSNWQFTGYETMVKEGHSKMYYYRCCKAFFDTLYTYLIKKGRRVEAEKLKNSIKSAEIEYKELTK